jgi:hypothetical protein
MPDQEDNQAQQAQQLTAAEAAKRVQRTVYEQVDTKANGKIVKALRPKLVAVQEAEVLAFRDYGTHVVVVTRDGQKLTDAEA